MVEETQISKAIGLSGVTCENCSVSDISGVPLEAPPPVGDDQSFH